MGAAAADCRARRGGRRPPRSHGRWRPSPAESACQQCPADPAGRCPRWAARTVSCAWPVPCPAYCALQPDRGRRLSGPAAETPPQHPV